MSTNNCKLIQDVNSLLKVNGFDYSHYVLISEACKDYIEIHFHNPEAEKYFTTILKEDAEVTFQFTKRNENILIQYRV